MNLQEQIYRIKEVMGLNEQSQGGGGQLVSNNVYKAISSIESVYSYADQNGDPVGASYNGNEKESNIRSSIESTIGLNYWFQMSDFLRGQIYSFMFQSDSGSQSKLRWLAGLAQMVNSAINRGDIIGKTTNDPNVQNAIKSIQQSISNGTINNLYSNYVNIVKDQYSKISGTPNDPANRLKIWGPRPIALDKLMRGESWSDVKIWWGQQIGGNNQSQQGNQSQQKSYEITAPTLDALWTKSKSSEYQNISIDENSFVVDLDNKKITFKSGNTPIKSMSFIFDDRGQLETRLESIGEKNSTMKVAKKDEENGIQWVILTF
jgi:hypothetical protein